VLLQRLHAEFEENMETKRKQPKSGRGGEDMLLVSHIYWMN
jgi:hypothetical protein